MAHAFARMATRCKMELAFLVRRKDVSRVLLLITANIVLLIKGSTLNRLMVNASAKSIRFSMTIKFSVCIAMKKCSVVLIVQIYPFVINVTPQSI